MTRATSPYRSMDRLGALRGVYGAVVRERPSSVSVCAGVGSLGTLAGVLTSQSPELAVAGAGVGILIGLTSLWARGREVDQVRVHEGGLVARSPAGERVVLWDDVKSFQRVRSPSGRRWGRGAGGGWRCVLALHQGEPLVVSDALPGCEALAAELEAQAHRHVAPVAFEAFAAGRGVEFGRLRVERAGLRREWHFVPWRAITAIAVLDGRIHVVEPRRSTPPWLVLTVDEIPNPRLFLELVAHARDALGADPAGDDAAARDDAAA